jgi:hypothetical protein
MAIKEEPACLEVEDNEDKWHKSDDFYAKIAFSEQ